MFHHNLFKNSGSKIHGENFEFSNNYTPGTTKLTKIINKLIAKKSYSKVV